MNMVPPELHPCEWAMGVLAIDIMAFVCLGLETRIYLLVLVFLIPSIPPSFVAFPCAHWQSMLRMRCWSWWSLLATSTPMRNVTWYGFNLSRLGPFVLPVAVWILLAHTSLDRLIWYDFWFFARIHHHSTAWYHFVSFVFLPLSLHWSWRSGFLRNPWMKRALLLSPLAACIDHCTIGQGRACTVIQLINIATMADMVSALWCW